MLPKNWPLRLLQPVDDGQRLCVGGLAGHIACHFTAGLGGLCCADQVEQQPSAIGEREENGALKNNASQFFLHPQKELLINKNKKERKEKDNPLIRKEGVNGPASYTLSSLSFGMVVLFSSFFTHKSVLCDLYFYNYVLALFVCTMMIGVDCCSSSQINHLNLDSWILNNNCQKCCTVS